MSDFLNRPSNFKLRVFVVVLASTWSEFGGREKFRSFTLRNCVFSLVAQFPISRLVVLFLFLVASWLQPAFFCCRWISQKVIHSFNLFCFSLKNVFKLFSVQWSFATQLQFWNGRLWRTYVNFSFQIFITYHFIFRSQVPKNASTNPHKIYIICLHFLKKQPFWNCWQNRICFPIQETETDF